jgi:hypothetical protein
MIMVALTYGDARVATPESKTAAKIATKAAASTAPRQTWFARFLAAMMESRMRQAEREVRLYAPQMLPLLREDSNTPHGGI